MTDGFYMEIALNEAWKYQGLTLPNPAVGAVVLDRHGKILGVGSHRQAGEPHGEVNAFKNSFLDNYADSEKAVKLQSLETSEEIHDFLRNNSNMLFNGGTIYITLEPCNHQGKTPPCSTLIRDLGIKKVVYSVADTNPNAEGGGEYLRSCGLEVIQGVLEEKGLELLEPFLKYQEKNFVFFKWAQNLGGGYTSGKISCDNSFEDVHKLRDKIDLIVIGGNTVRIDRPTLDARKVDGKVPDVLIFSNKKNFDKTIPLFNVPGREVFISSDITKIDQYKYVMIEGGNTLFELLKNRIHWTLTYQSNKASKGSMIEGGQVKYLHCEIMDSDLKIWGKYITN